MAHPSLDELTAMFQAARKAGEADKDNPEQLRLHRELLAACPAFTPNLLRLARLLQLIDQRVLKWSSQARRRSMRSIIPRWMKASEEDSLRS